MSDDNLVRIDAATFENQLAELAETIALKIDREGSTVIAAPEYVIQDCLCSYATLGAHMRCFSICIQMSAEKIRLGGSSIPSLLGRMSEDS
jgi:hypothetical protein